MEGKERMWGYFEAWLGKAFKSKETFRIFQD
jgi:hypothetical protein